MGHLIDHFEEFLHVHELDRSSRRDRKFCSRGMSERNVTWSRLPILDFESFHNGFEILQPVGLFLLLPRIYLMLGMGLKETPDDIGGLNVATVKSSIQKV